MMDKLFVIILIVLTFFLVIIALVAGANAQTVRTAHWYATHVNEMNDVLTRCHDDPGHLRNTPDCINAEQGLFEWTAAMGLSHIRQQMARDQAQREAIWQSNPRELATHLKMCNELPHDPKSQQFAHCPEAFAVARAMLANEKRK